MTITGNTRSYSTRQIARMLYVSDDKIRAWILVHELKAFDLSTSKGRKPRWRIPQEALDEFLARRASDVGHVPEQTVRRKKYEKGDGADYF